MVEPYAGNEKPFWVVFTDHHKKKRFYSSHDTVEEAQALAAQKDNCSEVKATHASECASHKAALVRQGKVTAETEIDFPHYHYYVIQRPKLVPLKRENPVYFESGTTDTIHSSIVYEQGKGPSEVDEPVPIMIPDPDWMYQEIPEILKDGLHELQ